MCDIIDTFSVTTQIDMECVMSDTVAVLSHHSVSDVKYTGYEFPNLVGLMIQIQWL